jgi:hypothetical protein
MSLPPMPTVTRLVVDVTALIWAGTDVPSSPNPGFRMSPVVAPAQLTSASDADRIAVSVSRG